MDRLFDAFSSAMQQADTVDKFAIGMSFFFLLGLSCAFLAYFGGQGLRSLLGGFAQMLVKFGDFPNILATGLSTSMTNVTGAVYEVGKGVNTALSTPSTWVKEMAQTERERIAAETPEATVTMRDGELSVVMKGPDANNRIGTVVEATPKALNSPFFRRLPAPSDNVVDVEYSGTDSSGRSVFNLPNLFRR